MLFYAETVLAGLPPKAYNMPAYAGSRSIKERPLFLGGAMDASRAPGKLKGPVGAGFTPFDARFHKKDTKDFGGPTQPEMQAFSSVNASNMVDLFSGDFSYNIPLLDVGGYPVNIAYRGGITMDQEASWVGLGWNVNPGTITRNMRGLPDDFNGATDSVTKTSSIKENRTVGVTAGANIEILGLPKVDSPKVGDTSHSGSIGISLGIFNNNYKGWGLETGLNASLNSGAKGAGPLSGGLSFTNNSQDGLTTTPSLTYRLTQTDKDGRFGESFSIAAPYNTRTGLRALQLSAGLNQSKMDSKNQLHSGSSEYASSISFANPSFTPTITMPYTSRQFSFTAKFGLAIKGYHPSFYVSGYVSKQAIDPEDRVSKLPAYGYLNFQNTNNDPFSLMDYNREKEIAYREKPAMPHIGVPSYTYDLFSITGEGTGGMFRPYRGDIGYVYDHLMKTRDKSDRLSVDIGDLDIFHGGVDLNINRSYTQTSPWIDENALGKTVQFRKNSGLYEAVYFRNPGEKSINSKAFYEAIGGDDVVAPDLYQATLSSATITATNYLNRYSNKSLVGKTAISSANVAKQERDKRSQVISYLTAADAETVSTSKYIESYALNNFRLASCPTAFPNPTGQGHGLYQEVWHNQFLEGPTYSTGTDTLADNLDAGEGVSVRWTGKVEAPVTGRYKFTMTINDGITLWLNDTLIANGDHHDNPIVGYANLVAGEKYRIKIEYAGWGNPNYYQIRWEYPGHSASIIPKQYLYAPGEEPLYFVDGIVTKEKRVNSFRKPNHLSEIDVLNADGRRYVYGIPVYNLKQKEVSFAINKSGGNALTSLASFAAGTDNSTSNDKGRDNYFSSEEIPAYAHSFLLTGILSPDYVDLTGDGISDDDLGDAVKFNYTRTADINAPYKWRAPYVKDRVTYNEGLKTDSRDDKGNYVYGEKELWYLNSIQSKNMVAAFFLENRTDLLEMNENGTLKNNPGKPKLLRKIALYNKADFLLKDTFAVPVKTVHFEYSYELCRGVNNPTVSLGKLTLKKIWFSYNGNNKGQQNPYVFSYNANNPGYSLNAYDRWGNYKDPANNPSTSGTISNADYPYTLQDSALSASNVAAWTLDSIKLPSGGRIKVQYESDDYAYVQNRRAMQLFKIAGFGSSPFLPTGTNDALYAKPSTFSSVDNLFVFVKVNQSVASNTEVLKKYLDGIDKLYFKLNIKVPSDKWGSGNENIPCYGDLENYGFMNDTTIWIKLKGIDLDGSLGGKYSPLVKTATQFLKLNLGSKAYPGSEVGENVDLGDAVKILLSQVDNVINAIRSFDLNARDRGWMRYADLNRSFVRLTCPSYKKLGGGARVKRVTVYDNWNAMTGQKESRYGQEYSYTTTKEINGVKTVISSGVASYEPGLGGEENPFHLPIEYMERASALGPVTLGYTEEPLGESFFPAASVGYSKVRVRSINTAKTRSANGYEETGFYTAYDFPTFVDRSMIDESTKKRFKPALSNFLRINARHYLTISQGFKVELNDMHGKMRFQASYPETDPDHAISYTENFYKVENTNTDAKRLANTVMAMAPDGGIDSTALIGKDAELMLDMREQRTVVNGINANVNSDFFSVGPGFAYLPSLLNLAQREETQFRSAAATKVIQRYGILDSVVHIDKGSKVSTKNMLYDSETGDVLLSRTQNEFNDPIYNFSYPAHWAYEGMGLAYKNIGVILRNVFIRDGRITRMDGKMASNVDSSANENDFFASGDEIFIQSKPKTGTGADTCNDQYATFPVQGRIWAIDANVLNGGTKSIYFIDKDGHAFTGNDITLTITRSGRRNMGGGVGAVSTLENPLVYNSGTHQYSLVLNTGSKVINASVAKFKQLWKVGDKKTRGTQVTCVNDALLACSGGGNCVCSCVKPLFDYILSQEKLLRYPSDSITLRWLVLDAIANGFAIDTVNCPIIKHNMDGYYYTLTTDITQTTSYIQGAGPWKARVGGFIIKFTSTNAALGNTFDDDGTNYISKPCTTGNQVEYKYRYWDVPSYGIPTDSTKAIMEVDSCSTETCGLLSSGICYSAITDTVVNPYTYGILGNFRADTTYTYYGPRTENDASSGTNIRRFGTFSDYSPFWSFASGQLKASPDTTRWAWNSTMTLFNKRGFELENKDPLGRYNAGLYGYNLTLPTAVVQNSQYRESAFEGFEDYGYASNSCDTGCVVGKHFDFSFYRSAMDSTQSHTGRYSLKVPADSSMGIAAIIGSSGFTDPSLVFTTASGCAATRLKTIKTDSSALLPIFSPIAGKKLLFSAWVKETKDCKCESYTGNSVVVTVTTASGSTNYTYYPQGNIIEGWQRYENIVDLPSNTVSISVNLRAAAGGAVYFDDIRLHPFNANMKSFVYDPVNLRLVAELDENNYASFYEYDDDGTLVRVKKETERGIRTIKETRSALRKE